RVVGFARSPAESLAMIEASVRGPTPPIPATYVREFLDEYIHVPDNGSYSAESVSIYSVFNVSSAVVPIMALPILTRYSTPEDYGSFTIFTIVSMFAGNAFRLESNMALKREYVEAPQKFSPYVSSATVF
ncbi:hypothetical protein OY671_012083, partial [Metschnikowia pulcherrima]